MAENTTLPLVERMENFLSSTPNRMASESEMLCAIYPHAVLGDKASGMLIGCIRRVARNNCKFRISGRGAAYIALIN